MAVMASSTACPMVDWWAWDWSFGQRAAGGTQKKLWARYSSGSSGSAPWPRSVSNWPRPSSKASEMYFRKMRPRTTCLYSAASMLHRSARRRAPKLSPVDLGVHRVYLLRQPPGMLRFDRKGLT